MVWVRVGIAVYNRNIKSRNNMEKRPMNINPCIKCSERKNHGRYVDILPGKLWYPSIHSNCSFNDSWPEFYAECKLCKRRTNSNPFKDVIYEWNTHNLLPSEDENFLKKAIKAWDSILRFHSIPKIESIEHSYGILNMFFNIERIHLRFQNGLGLYHEDGRLKDHED